MRYVEKREETLQLLSDTFRYAEDGSPCSREDAKDLLLRTLNGGGVRCWRRDKGIEKFSGDSAGISFLRDYQREAQVCCAIVAESRSDIRDISRLAGRPRPEMTAVAYYLAEIEDAALQILEREAESRGVSVCAPCFGGCLLRGREREANQALLAAQRSVLAELQIEVQFEIKVWPAGNASVARQRSVFEKAREVGTDAAEKCETLPGRRLMCLPAAILNLVGSGSSAARAIRSLKADGPYTYKALLENIPHVTLRIATAVADSPGGAYILHEGSHAAGLEVNGPGTVLLKDSTPNKATQVAISWVNEYLAAGNGAGVYLFELTDAKGSGEAAEAAAFEWGEMSAGGKRRPPEAFRTTAAKLKRKREYSAVGVDALLRTLKWYRPSRGAAMEQRHACAGCGSFGHKWPSHQHALRSVLKHALKVNGKSILKRA